MQNILHNWVKSINAMQKKKRLWIRGSCIAGCLVVFCTFYALILPAITMEYGERALDCPLSVHEHTDECKNEEGERICGQADFVVHTHADGCYDAEGTLTCLLPEVEEHSHTEECYTSSTELVCTTEVHVHDDGCYEVVVETTETSEETSETSEGTTEASEEADNAEPVLICTKGEHSHGDACYEIQNTLTCEKEEVSLHSHGEGCYETNEDEEEVLVCTMLEVTEHVHSDACFVEVNADADSEEESQPASLPAETETTALIVEEKVDADAAVMAADTGDVMVVASGTCGENATWVLTDDGVLKISGMGAMDNYSSGKAPWSSNRYSITSVVIMEGITSIGDYVFYECNSLTSITIPEGVTSIGDHTFYYCRKLTSITLPESLTSIGDYAFGSCDSLTSITIPEGVISIGENPFSTCRCLTNIHVDDGNPNYTSIDGVLFNKTVTTLIQYPAGKTGTSYEVPEGVTSIGCGAFSSCDNLTSITLPESLTSIGEDAFVFCDSLTSITLPERLTFIGDYAFGSCDSLTSINIPEGVTSIGDYTFYNCDSLTSITIPEGVTSIDEYAFSGCNNLTSIIIPEGVTSIRNRAFLSCGSLTSITLPESLTSIGYYAFSSCGSLTSITIPEGVTSIGFYVFDYCENLTDIHVDTGNASYASIDGVLFDKAVTTLKRYPEGKTGTSYEVPDGVTSIGNYAFSGCSRLTCITIPEGVTSIGSSAFSGGIKRLVLQTGMASAYSYNDSALEEIIIGEQVDGLELKTLKIFASGSDAMERIVFTGPNYFHCTGDDYTFGKLPLTAGEYYADEYGVVYRLEGEGTATVWYVPEDLACDNYTILAEIPSETDPEVKYTVTAIRDYVFQNCAALGGVTIPEGVTKIGAWAFYRASSLASVNGETSLKEVMNKWRSAGANSSTFAGTALWDSGHDEAYPVTADSIEAFDSTGRKITLSISENKDVLTGQNVQSTLTIDEGDEDSADVIRVYFQFESSAGSLDYKVGTHDFEINDSDKITVNVCRSNVESIYYVEVPCILAGQTLNLNLPSKYANFSAGGMAMIWLEVLSKEKAQNLGNGITVPEKVHLATWGTKADTFPVSKWTRSNRVTVKGDGTDSGQVSLSAHERRLEYGFYMERSGATSDYGKDVMTSADFLDTMVLPEPFEWRDGVVEAIRNGNYDCGNYTTTYTYWYVMVDGKMETLAILYDDGNAENVLLDVDDAGNIIFGWTYTNSSSSAEIQNFSEDFVIYSNMIVADSADLAEDLEEAGDSVTYTIENSISVTQHFSYSEDQHQTATAKREISVGAADYTIEKEKEKDPYMGEAMNFTITLKNETALPYTALDYVTDPVPDYSYITPADMETMFYNDTYGENLTISIAQATLAEIVSHTVTGTDGQQYTITQQYEGTDTDYEGKTTTDSGLITDSADITIGWAEDKSYLVLTASYADTVITHAIGTEKDCGSIQEALNGIGYLVTNTASYTCTWDLEGQTLYSGEKRVYYVRTTVKDTFMRLTGDQDWYIIDGTQYASSVSNYADAYDVNKGHKYDSVSCRIYRDFTLNKEAYLDGELVEKTEAGDVLTYRIDVTHAGDAAYDAMPVTDNMEGGQVLLVSASENTALEGQGLETMDVDGVTHYLLNRPDIYESVLVGNHLADRVVVTETDNGLDTVIYWYLTEVSREVTVTVEYPALVSPEKAGLTLENTTFDLDNEVWLSDHETHRLYDRAFLYGTVLRMNKYIVTNVDNGELSDLSHHDYTKDILSERTNIHADETVVYRLLLEGLGGPVTVNGSGMYDVLPASLSDYWSSGNVTVTYVKTEGTKAKIQNGNDWYIETDPENRNQQYLRWRDDFSATIEGTLYIYVTLTFPKDTAWADYCHAYGKQDVSNTFHVYQLQDEVFHHLSVSAEVLLQKGVYRTGTTDIENINNYSTSSYRYATDASSLWHYTNDTQSAGIVTYYVTLYNSGDTRVYLSSLQDVLPFGFAFYSLYSSDNDIYFPSKAESKSNRNYGYDTLAFLTVSGDEQIIYKRAYIQAVATKNSNGQEVVNFSFSNNESYGDLCHDDRLGKYYLDTGEALVFAYHCATNDYMDTEDVVTNTIAMPYYDYNGAGVNLNTGTVVDRKETNGLDSNNGNREVITTGQAELIGMDCAGADNSTLWLSSDVTIRRGDVMPGITKSVQESFAAPTDVVTWNIRVSNSGTYDMRNYTITDAMMAPYQFTGSVGYKICFDAWSRYYAENANLFTFGERKPDDTTVTINFNEGTYKEETAELMVNGDYQDIAVSMHISQSHGTLDRPVKLQVRLCRDKNGNEILYIRFPADEYNVATIPSSGTAVMTLQTKNFTNTHSNTTYFNTSYITPSVDQPFDTGAVSQGNYTIFDEKDSVVSEANVAVAYGYATSSQKSVAELENPENEAVSTGSTNSIVLPAVESLFRYTLTVNNTGGDSASQAMDKLVLIDDLPQKNDHVTFYPDIPRYSEFKVDFADADELDFDVSVNGTFLDSSKYVVEFSEKTEFDSEDWKGTGTEGWFSMSDITTLSNMRSVRVKILDENGTLIPADAVITVSFNAWIDTSKGVPPSSAVAWNSFGYRYSLLGDSTELEAAPQKVGVKMPSVPVLVKELVGSNGDAYSAREDATFRFVIYEGEAITLREGYTEADVFTALSEKNFTVVDLTVKAGERASNAVKLDDQHCLSYTDGVLLETKEIWSWTHLSRYTIMELPLLDNSVYTFGAFDRIHPNNYTFSYNAASNRTITCSNVRDVWEILVSKTCETTEKPLSGAVFGIYSTKESDKISDEIFAALTANLRTDPKCEITVDGTTWYLMDIQTSDANGKIRWSGLVEESYYVQELQAPDGYSFEQEGKVLSRGNGNSVTIEVTNKPGYKLPETGGPGTKFLTTAGLLLMITALVLLFKRRWGGAISG